MEVSDVHAPGNVVWLGCIQTSLHLRVLETHADYQSGFRPKSKAEEAMGQMGRITSLQDLPSDRILAGYIQQAIRLNEQGIQVPRPEKPKAKKKLVIPPILANALKRNKQAQQTFDNFSPSHKREYIEWIVEAKRDETRTKRLETAIAWLSEGKPRNWKYLNA